MRSFRGWQRLWRYGRLTGFEYWNGSSFTASSETDGMVTTSTYYTDSITQNPYLFQGRRLDTESALYYFRNRQYDPQHGSFISRDPAGYTDSHNLYQFVNNNPICYTDPMGLSLVWDILHEMGMLHPLKGAEKVCGSGWSFVKNGKGSSPPAMPANSQTTYKYFNVDTEKIETLDYGYHDWEWGEHEYNVYTSATPRYIRETLDRPCGRDLRTQVGIKFIDRIEDSIDVSVDYTYSYEGINVRFAYSPGQEADVEVDQTEEIYQAGREGYKLKLVVEVQKLKVNHYELWISNLKSNSKLKGHMAGYYEGWDLPHRDKKLMGSHDEYAHWWTYHICEKKCCED